MRVAEVDGVSVIVVVAEAVTSLVKESVRLLDLVVVCSVEKVSDGERVNVDDLVTESEALLLHESVSSLVDDRVTESEYVLVDDAEPVTDSVGYAVPLLVRVIEIEVDMELCCDSVGEVDWENVCDGLTENVSVSDAVCKVENERVFMTVNDFERVSDPVIEAVGIDVPLAVRVREAVPVRSNDFVNVGVRMVRVKDAVISADGLSDCVRLVLVSEREIVRSTLIDVLGVILGVMDVKVPVYSNELDRVSDCVRSNERLRVLVGGLE